MRHAWSLLLLSCSILINEVPLWNHACCRLRHARVLNIWLQSRARPFPDPLVPTCSPSRAVRENGLEGLVRHLAYTCPGSPQLQHFPCFWYSKRSAAILTIAVIAETTSISIGIGLGTPGVAWNCPAWSRGCKVGTNGCQVWHLDHNWSSIDEAIDIHSCKRRGWFSLVATEWRISSFKPPRNRAT